MLYIDGAYQAAVSAACCLLRSTPNLFWPGARAALLVGGPRVGIVAAADDAVVADDVELLRVLRDDRQLVDVALESHRYLPKNVGQTAVQKLVDSLGIDVAIASTRSTYCGRFWVACPQISSAGLAVETGVVAGQFSVRSLVVSKRKALVRTDRGETNDVAVGAGPGWNALAELDENPGCIVVRIRDIQRLIDLEVMDIAESV